MSGESSLGRLSCWADKWENLVSSTVVFDVLCSVSLINLWIGLTPSSAIPSPVLIIIVLPYLCFTGHQSGFSPCDGALCKPIWCCFPTRVLPGPFLKATIVLLDFPHSPPVLMQVLLCSRSFPVPQWTVCQWSLSLLLLWGQVAQERPV